MDFYADIVLPLARGVFTFAADGDVRAGQCVRVQFGPRKHCMGVVWRVHGERPPYKTIKRVEGAVEGAPALTADQMRFWEWLADYYMCTLGEVMSAAMPSALRPEGFSEQEFVRDCYRTPTVQYVSLGVRDEAALNEAFEALQRRAARQYGALLELVAELGDRLDGEVPRRRLSADTAALKALAAKGIVRIAERELPSGELPPMPSSLPALTPAQRQAADDIRRQFADKDVVLLRGVTGSGKTEIYIDLIAETLAAGRNVLYLVPEIAMSSQLVERVRGWFGERVVVYHSCVAERRRVETYRRVAANGGGEVVLGVRSSVLLPLRNLGLVIVDEEHDQSYKQADTAPRYHARDAAIVLARETGAKTVLGSATPSLESYSNAAQGKYGSVVLDERYGGGGMPRMIISDTLRAVSRGERTVHFNKALLDRLAETLSARRQAMLFQNRRGFAPYLECTECGAVVMCRRCNVSLTYHKTDGLLRCHYCGRTQKPPTVCPSCGKAAVAMRGFGTEKVEQELAALFPDARIDRLDRDTATSWRRLGAIIAAVERGETDILVGTQMITKGFDFGGVSLVGVLNADNLLAYPDFRAAERAFQTITQVAGRAGRRDERGEVVIQTAQPASSVIRQAADGDYETMAREQLAERAEFLYPPYCRLIEVTLRHRDADVLWGAANFMAVAARAHFGRMLLGPQPPSVDKVRGEWLLTLLLKVERGSSFADARRMLRDAIASTLSRPEYKYVRTSCNVDPQ